MNKKMKLSELNVKSFLTTKEVKAGKMLTMETCDTGGPACLSMGTNQWFICCA